MKNAAKVQKIFHTRKFLSVKFAKYLQIDILFKIKLPLCNTEFTLYLCKGLRNFFSILSERAAHTFNVICHLFAENMYKSLHISKKSTTFAAVIVE